MNMNQNPISAPNRDRPKGYVEPKATGDNDTGVPIEE
jgi:hypothetical protein